ncbi:MAG: AAA family ATPase, partial [Janthinobacterium lividum]
MAARTAQHLRERQHELDQAHEALVRAAAAGVGRVLVVTGEPGIGKTAVLDAVRRDALTMGAAVGFGKADEVNQITPGAPVLLALRSGAAPLLDDAGYRSLAPLHDKPLWLVDQLVELLEVRARDGLVLVVLDDMQWADQLSQFLVRALASRLVGSPVVWVLAARAPSASVLAGPDVNQLFDDVSVQHLPLSPLSESAVLDLAAELLGGVPAGTPAATFTRAGGNPFFVVQLCQALTPGPADGDETVIPFSLAAVLRRRLSSLSAGAAELVELAAAWGLPLPLAAARQMLECSIADLVDHAQQAAAAGLLVLSGTSFEFRHDLLREFVYEGLAENRRTALHAACTRYLLESGDGSAAAAVPHARIVARHGDRAGVELLRRAARECRTSTPLAAASLMQEAFAASDPNDPSWPEIGEECAELLSSAQRGSDVAATVDTLLARPHTAELEARLQVLAAHALWLVGHVDDMALRTSRALIHSGISKPLRSRLQAAHALALSRLGPMADAAAA